jgi:hypothetical protein
VSVRPGCGGCATGRRCTRQGTADDPATVLVLALSVGLTGLMIAGLMIGGPAGQLRRAARDLPFAYYSRSPRPPQIIERAD